MAELVGRQVIKYKAGYKYQLQEAYVIQLPDAFAGVDSEAPFYALRDGILVIRKHYAWDGPSGPTIDTKTFMRGSLVHDVLYQMIREGLLSKELKDDADRLLQTICIEDGMSKFRAWYVYQAVKRFGKQPMLSNKDIKVAP